jgi:23S rRNA (cytosine1962-C5)-methyltransferase
MTLNSKSVYLSKALDPRLPMLDEAHTSGLRLFSGFYEGEPDLVADLYGSTLLLTSYSDSPEVSSSLLSEAQEFYLSALPWLDCILQKQKTSNDQDWKRGKVTFGTSPAGEVMENGIRFALDLRMNQDASLYLDTRNLRTWLKENCRGQSVFNAFAYTGSLGVAALSGGAERVVQVDLNARFLDLARRSAMLNRLDLGRMKLRAADFFSEVGRFKQEDRLFDLALLDPPFFSVTQKGKVDLVAESARIINKIRPLIKHGGRLISINNALFLSGKDYMDSLQALCQDGYMEIETIIPIPQDFTGFVGTIVSKPPVKSAPFNHSTKIAILKVNRKDGRTI